MAWTLLGSPSLALANHEEFRPPRAICLAIPGPVRTLARLRRDGGPALRGQHQRGLAAPEDPLLQSENCQKWIAEKIVTIKTEVRAIDGRLAEVDFIERLGDPTSPALVDHYRRVEDEYQGLLDRIREGGA